MSDIGDKNMKWDNDRFSYEKHLVMDVIIKFSETFEGKDHSKISIKELTDFIDKFFERKNETHKS